MELESYQLYVNLGVVIKNSIYFTLGSCQHHHIASRNQYSGILVPIVWMFGICPKLSHAWRLGPLVIHAPRVAPPRRSSCASRLRAISRANRSCGIVSSDRRVAASGADRPKRSNTCVREAPSLRSCRIVASMVWCRREKLSGNISETSRPQTCGVVG